MKFSKLTKTIKEIINQHQIMTPKVRKDLEKEGFEWRTIGKYLRVRSQDLFIAKVVHGESVSYYVGVGTCAMKYGYYEENSGMVKEITRTYFNKLKKEITRNNFPLYSDLTNYKNLWIYN